METKRNYRREVAAAVKAMMVGVDLKDMTVSEDAVNPYALVVELRIQEGDSKPSSKKFRVIVKEL